MANVAVKQTFWDDKHARKDKYWLTGSQPLRVLHQHNVKDEFSKASSFLDIGVGFGVMTRWAKEQHKIVYGCDISQVALNGIKDIADEVSTDLRALKPVDLAVCHLVFQHCDDETVTNIIHQTRLNRNGVLSFQFACLRPGEKPNGRVQRLLDSGTHYIRSLTDIENLISKTDKKLVSVSEPIDHRHGENLRWYFCKVVNSSG